MEKPKKTEPRRPPSFTTFVQKLTLTKHQMIITASDTDNQDQERKTFKVDQDTEAMTRKVNNQ